MAHRRSNTARRLKIEFRNSRAQMAAANQSLSRFYVQF